jgi:ligand-binding sensor domain-containing protein
MNGKIYLSAVNKYYLRIYSYMLLLAALSFNAYTAHGQSKMIKTQGSDQFQNVHCGLQDKAGNLWFGTTGEGVYRYDGKSFTQFSKKDGLNSNTVYSIAEDKTGNVWLGTSAGICRYNGKTFAAVPIAANSGSQFYTGNTLDNNTPEKNTVWSIMQARNGNIWFGTDEGVFRYNGKGFTHFPENGIVNPDGVHLKMIQCMLEDKKGNIWFGSGQGESEGLIRFDGKTLTRFKPNGDGWVRSMLEDKKGNIWLACRVHGICRYDGKTFSPFAPKETFSGTGTGALTEDKTGNIWFSSLGRDEDGGVWRFDGKSFSNFTTKDGLTNNSVFCILQDRSGNLWFGSRNTGLTRYDGKSFIRFSD